MSSQGPNNPSAGASVDGSNIAWSNPTNIYTSNAVYATVLIGGAQISQYLQGTNFGFSIPVGATINGIVVEIQKMGEVDMTFTDQVVQLIKGGTKVGNNKADLVNNWPTTEAYTTYGANNDLWGTTWSVSDINGTGFGVAIQVNTNDVAYTAYVDHMRITVYYTAAAGATNSYGYIF